jgi:DNA-directed RNA polymerase specialized sigma24 family protein
MNPDGVFATTRWTLVVRARGESPEARAALGDLCAAYYAPVESFLRRETGDPATARELAQEFFSRLLAGSGFGGADERRGRFRSYVLGAVKHFLQAERTRRGARKRGGNAEHLSLDAAGAATGTDAGPGTGLDGTAPQIPDPAAVSPDAAFDRQWAHSLLERALDRLSRDMAAEGKSRQFEILQVCLLGAETPPPQAELAVALGLGETAVKVAIHRLRARFRETVRAEIAETLADPTQVDEEMRHLIAALAG